MVPVTQYLFGVVWTINIKLNGCIQLRYIATTTVTSQTQNDVINLSRIESDQNENSRTFNKRIITLRYLNEEYDSQRSYLRAP